MNGIAEGGIGRSSYASAQGHHLPRFAVGMPRRPRKGKKGSYTLALVSSTQDAGVAWRKSLLTAGPRDTCESTIRHA